MDPLCDLRIGSQQAQVSVEAGGNGVVVAGAEVAVAAGLAILVAAHQQGQLAMGFEADHPVEDLHSGVLHAARPADIRGLVEARHQLDHQRGFLGGRGLNQRSEDGRVVAGAIEGLLHRDHCVVLSALLDEIHYRIVGVVRMVEQDIALPHLVEDVGGLAAQFEGLGREGRELQLRPLHVAIKEHQPRKIHRAIAAEDLGSVEFEVAGQPVDDLRVGAGLHLQAHRVALAAVMQLHADGLQQRARFFLLEVEVRVAGDAKGGVAQHFVAAVHAGQVLRDQVLKQQVIVGAVGRGQPDKARQRPRHRHHSQNQRPRAAPLEPEQQRQAESLVEHTRKGVSRIDGNRRQQRIDLAQKIALRKVPGLFVQLLPLQQSNALFAQLGQQAVVPALVLRLHEAVNIGGQHGQRFVRTQAVEARLAVAVLDALHQAGLTDLDVLVQVRARDGQKLYPLQQRVCRIFRLFKHTPVKLHPGVVPPVEELLFLWVSSHQIRSMRRVGSLRRFRGKLKLKSSERAKTLHKQGIFG